MNIALGALIITILLLPGAFILKAYYSSFKEKDKELYVPFAELLFRGFIWSLICHFVAILVILLFGIDVDYNLLYKITIGDKFSINNTEFRTSFLQFCFYNIVLLSLAACITKIIRLLIVRKNLDLLFHGLRLSNFWFYTFSARTLERSRTGEYETTDLLYVDILSKKDIVYSGFLFDFEYSPSKDKMETLTLKNATKRTYIKVEDLKNGEEKPHKLKHSEPRLINGDSFILLWEDVVNINIYYINVKGLNQST
jgi:hypothetical protein